MGFPGSKRQCSGLISFSFFFVCLFVCTTHLLKNAGLYILYKLKDFAFLYFGGFVYYGQCM